MVDFQVSKILGQPMFYIGSPHDNDTRISASKVSSFSQLQQSLFTQLRLEIPRSHIIGCACRAEVAGVIGLGTCLLECQDWSLAMFLRCKLQPLYFVTCSFWRDLHCEEWKLCKTHFREVPPQPQRLKKTFVTAKVAFDKCWWRLQYWTLGS